MFLARIARTSKRPPAGIILNCKISKKCYYYTVDNTENSGVLDPREVLLIEKGSVAPADTHIHVASLAMHLTITRLYGVETRLPDGGTGRIIVRGVEQMPDRYALSHPSDEEHWNAFRESKMSGFLVDKQVTSLSGGHLFVGYRALLRVANDNGTCTMSSNESKQFGLGRNIDDIALMDTDPTNAEIVRELEVPEMTEFSVPSRFNLVMRALTRK